MYLIDTNVISEIRKGKNANKGVQDFFSQIAVNDTPIYLSVITIGELRRGIEMIRHRNDEKQAKILENWLDDILLKYAQYILPFDTNTALLWGYLRVPHYENLLDKQIAATALINDLTVVTRNTTDFAKSRVNILNPFKDK